MIIYSIWIGLIWRFLCDIWKIPIFKSIRYCCSLMSDLPHPIIFDKTISFLPIQLPKIENQTLSPFLSRSITKTLIYFFSPNSFTAPTSQFQTLISFWFDIFHLHVNNEEYLQRSRSFRFQRRGWDPWIRSCSLFEQIQCL